MSRRRTREGYLFVKQSGRSAFGKSWKRKWVVVQPNNTRSQVGELATLSLVLELYIEKGAYGKTVNSVLIEGATEVRRILSKSQSLAFEVRNEDKVLVTAAGESETESQEWMAMFRQQLLPIIRQKELTRLPDASQDGYKVSVIPNKYSEGLNLSGDMLAHVTSMTIGVYDIYEGTLIKEWDLRHTKRFSLQSKGPVKDVDRIAVIQISNRSPHGEGELLLFSFNAKAFLERIYENLNTAMNVKSKRTKTSSMLFEIPPKELEALGKEINEEKTTTSGAGENGSAQKEEAKEEVTGNAADETDNKEQADVGTQLSEKAENEDLTADQEKASETEQLAQEEGATSLAEENTDEAKGITKEEEPSGGEESAKKDAADASHQEKEDKVDEGQEEGQKLSSEVTGPTEKQEEQQAPGVSGDSDVDSTQKADEGENVVEPNPEQDKPNNNTQQTVVEVHATEDLAEEEQEKDREKASDISESKEDTTSSTKVEESEETSVNETRQEEPTDVTVEPVANDSSEVKDEQKEEEPSGDTQAKEERDQSTAVEEETKQEEVEGANSATEDDTNQVKDDAIEEKTPGKSSVDDTNNEDSPKDEDEKETSEKDKEVDSKSPEKVAEQDNEPTQTESKEGEENEGAKTEEATGEDEAKPASQETGEHEKEKSENDVDKDGEIAPGDTAGKDQEHNQTETLGEQSEGTKTGETEEEVNSSPQETVEEESSQTSAAAEPEKGKEDGKDVNQEPSEEPVKLANDEGSIEDQKSSDAANEEDVGPRQNEDKVDELVEKSESNTQESAPQVEDKDET